MKKRILSLIAAVMIGMTAVPMPAAAVQVVIAQPTQSAIYVNGQPINTLPVYNINGYNYFKLRDIAACMDFGCVWNAVKKCMEIDTTAPYDWTQVSTAPATAQKNAVLSDQDLYVDGIKQNPLLIYNIDNNNYFKLRDLAAIIDFGCIWSPEKNCIELSSAYGYNANNIWGQAKQNTGNRVPTNQDTIITQQPVSTTEETEEDGIPVTKFDDIELAINDKTQMTISGPKVRSWSSSNPSVATVDKHGLITAVSAGSSVITVDGGVAKAQFTVNVKAPTTPAVSEAEAYAMIMALQSKYPEGMHWTDANEYYSKTLHLDGYGCAAFAAICSDTVFGDRPVFEKHSDFDRIRVGDMIRIGNTHSVVVLARNGDTLTVAEGNYNSSIHWGRQITRQELKKSGFYVETRY